VWDNVEKRFETDVYIHTYIHTETAFADVRALAIHSNTVDPALFL
jgi:hypothetical protein